MNLQQSSTTHLAALISVSMLSMVLHACSAPPECFEQGYSRSYSNRGTAVYVTVNSNELILVNDTPYPVYHEEFIDVIEWRPCDRPEDCPEVRIEPGEAGHIDLRSFGNEAEDPIWVYWWHIIDPGTELDTELDVDSHFVQLILIDLPPRVRCEEIAT